MRNYRRVFKNSSGKTGGETIAAKGFVSKGARWSRLVKIVKAIHGRPVPRRRGTRVPTGLEVIHRLGVAKWLRPNPIPTRLPRRQDAFRVFGARLWRQWRGSSETG